MKQIRDNEYYEDRLKTEHPALFADVVAGRLSKAQAFRKAGLKKPRTRLQEMTNAWDRSTSAEKHAFLAHIGMASPLIATSGVKPPAAVSMTSASPTSITAATSKRPAPTYHELQPKIAERIQDIMDKRKLKPGDVAEELGFKRLDASLPTAIVRGTRINSRMMAALALWLKANSSV
ncbi:hypothetical protein [Pseudogemmobacter sp. W21_MBD1_M6]|uniref:hypothetical protein n=1 Tax=Pseudogemmobacter sp. W21_MBD1_M6 TaxID=3240271 RepID=UPI003F96DB84